MRPWIWQLFTAAILSAIAIARTDFSLEAIQAPLLESEQIPYEIAAREFRFLGKGRQSFVFLSEDGQTVLKFFNKRYFEVPWYGRLIKSEEPKRHLRKSFYQSSYRIAEEFLKDETGILYLHTGRTEGLPDVVLIDRASRRIRVDLNRVPFVLQKKAEPLYTFMSRQAIDSFLDIVEKRITCGITDADHDVEHNFGFLDGRAVHIDPGRFSMGKEIDLDQEWWSATHRFRDYLEEKRPDLISDFESALQTRKQRMLPPSLKSQALQRDGSPPR